ncbi:MAG TPA: glycosyltransferase, partial [Vicinamibacterales bacterium]|nr:glycosyltransferase [Vicinamibacterales bacterium]
VIVSLHDDSRSAVTSPVGIEVRGARGSRLGFVAAAINATRRADRSTMVACSHLHLAPVAKLVSVLGSGARPTVMLCGIEAWTPLRRLERLALASSEVAAISQNTVDRFKAANPMFRDLEVHVCHPGLPATGTPALGLSSMALIVARMSAAERYKGHDLLLEMWPRVLKRHPNAILVVAGEGDDRSRLEGRARALGVAGAVRFVGAVSDNTLATLYEQCRFFVMPSRGEGFGLVFLEAMRAGKACIGGTGAAAEIIEHGATGFVVDPANGQDLEMAVQLLYDDPDMCARYGGGGRERFLSMFTDRHFQARFAGIIAHQPARALAPSMPRISA